MKNDVIALVGAGKGGAAILDNLVQIEGIEIRYVYDTNPDAPGMVFAALHNIKCLTDTSYAELIADDEVDLVLEVTGIPDVFKKLRAAISPKGIVIGAVGAKIIFHLLENQQRVTDTLERLKLDLQTKVVERTEDLEDANRKLNEKILEYESLNEKLERAIEDKTKYLLHATHQLKAPFAAIQSYADLILEGYTGEIPEQTFNVTQKIRIRCDLLTRSIKEMLELSNLQTCREENLRIENVHVNELIRETVKQFDVLAKNRSIKITFAPFEKDITVKCSAEHTKTLFSILLDNAINYSDDNTSIEIKTALQDKTPVVSVVDHGIGIAEEKIDKVFKEFFRTNDAAEKHTNGSGLGLSIAREIAKLNGFRLSVESEFGKGAKFTVMMH